MSKRKTISEVLNEFKNVHGNEYDYSLINHYGNRKEKLPIICHKKDENGIEHGIFYQSSAEHFQKKHGCPKCAKNGIKYSQKEFEEKIKKIFNGKYEVNGQYVNAHTPLKFVCCEHGEFTTKPYYLLQNHGCPKCGKKILSDKLSFTKEDAIKKFKSVHKDKYDYSKFEYHGYNSPSIFICHKIGRNGNEHGEFLQTPHCHINGRGCPKCNSSKLEKELIYLFEDNGVFYESQKRFEWLKQQKLDFYLPKYKIAVECQGEQHYVPCNFGSKKKTAEEMFSYIKERDIAKKQLCEKHDIKIFYYTNITKGEKAENTFYDKNELLKTILNNGIK